MHGEIIYKIVWPSSASEDYSRGAYSGGEAIIVQEWIGFDPARKQPANHCIGLGRAIDT